MLQRSTLIWLAISSFVTDSWHLSLILWIGPWRSYQHQVFSMVPGFVCGPLNINKWWWAYWGGGGGGGLGPEPPRPTKGYQPLRQSEFLATPLMSCIVYLSFTKVICHLFAHCAFKTSMSHFSWRYILEWFVSLLLPLKSMVSCPLSFIEHIGHCPSNCKPLMCYSNSVIHIRNDHHTVV